MSRLATVAFISLVLVNPALAMDAGKAVSQSPKPKAYGKLISLKDTSALSPTVKKDLNRVAVDVKKNPAGSCVIFHGRSGTGKTLAASELAKQLGKEAFQVDLSAVVSKYIGETEKNLKRLFEQAESRNWILFFDEADALFGKRTEVEDAHDRYANVEVNYLLAQLEAHKVIWILTTNSRTHLDPAFEARCKHRVKTP